MMYATIKQHASTRDLYAQRLISEDVLTAEEDAALMERYRESLDRGEPLVTQLVMEPNTNLFVDWKPYLGHSWDMACDTSIDTSRLRELAEVMGTIPDGFALQRQVKKLLEDRGKWRRAHSKSTGASPRTWPTPHCWLTGTPSE